MFLPMQVLTFIIICLVVYFIIVLPMNAALNRLYVSTPTSLQFSMLLSACPICACLLSYSCMI